MLIIGFGHKARQGKNTAAIAMLNVMQIERRARIYAYADALRAEVKRAIANAGTQKQLIEGRHIWDGEPFTTDATCTTLPDWVIAEEGKPRTLLQWWGTDYRRAQDVNYWVHRLEETLDREQPETALITDVRFPNEIDAIHARGGYVVKVTRTTAPDINVPSHPSENALDGSTGWDFELTAEDLPELRKKAAALYTKIAGKHGR